MGICSYRAPAGSVMIHSLSLAELLDDFTFEEIKHWIKQDIYAYNYLYDEDTITDKKIISCFQHYHWSCSDFDGHTTNSIAFHLNLGGLTNGHWLIITESQYAELVNIAKTRMKLEDLKLIAHELNNTYHDWYKGSNTGTHC